MKETARVASMVMIVSSGILLWMGTACAEEPDYFPLQVGNWWIYEYVNPSGTIQAKVIPNEADEVVDPFFPNWTMAVIGTMVIGSVAASRWYSLSELPVFEDGDMYYVLAGSMVGIAIGFPLGKSMNHAVLIRRDVSKNHILLRGIFDGKRWLILKEEKMVFDFSLNMVGWEVFIEEVKECKWIIWWGDRTRGRLVIPAGTFEAIVFVVDGTFCPEFAPRGYNKWFTEGLGLISVGDRHPEKEEIIETWDLKEAFVNGITYPLSSIVEQSSWGDMKAQHVHTDKENEER